MNLEVKQTTLRRLDILPPSDTTPRRKYLMSEKLLPTQKKTLPTQKQKSRPAALLPDQPATTLRPDQSGQDYTTPTKSTTPSISEEHSEAKQKSQD